MKLVPVLLASMMVAGALAGCFHGDDKKDNGDGGDDGNGNGNGNGDNNTTTPPPVVKYDPVADIKILDAGGNETNVTAVHGTENATISITLDASNSTDQDGNITIWAWSVTGPRGFEFTNQNETAEMAISDDNGYGIYVIRLTVIDDENGVGTANETLYVNYEITRPGVMGTLVQGQRAPAFGQGTRPGDGGCDQAGCNENTVTTLANATGATFRVTWESSEIVTPNCGTSTCGVGLWIVDPDNNVINSAPPGGSPRELVLTGSQLEKPGQYEIEARINGASNSGGFQYTFYGLVRYDPV